MTNRRLHIRHRRRLKVTLSHTSCFSADVSAGGFCAVLIRGLPPGTRVDGSIQADGKDAPFAGSVIWVKPGDVGLSLRARIGVRFTRIGEDYLRLLAREEEARRSPFPGASERPTGTIGAKEGEAVRSITTARTASPASSGRYTESRQIRSA